MNEYGTPAGALVDASSSAWTTRDRVEAGRKGELACAAFLSKTFAHDPDVYVFHDLNIPGMKANVDHAVIRGRRLLLIDAKRWKPGVYWTVKGQTRRGREKIDWADKATMPAALRIFRERLTADADVKQLRIDVAPLTLVFPSGHGPFVMWGYRPPDRLPIKVVKHTTHLWLRNRMSGNPNPQAPLLKAIWGLVKDQNTAVAHGQAHATTPVRST